MLAGFTRGLGAPVAELIDFSYARSSASEVKAAGRVGATRYVASGRPDVFLSIHHNADAGSRHDLNETQTYYKFSDPLASYDLGQAIHRHLTLRH